MTIFYFGESWDAAMFDVPDDDSPPPVHCPTPIGVPCGSCKEAIADGDRGQMIPFVQEAAEGALTDVSMEPHHIECLWLNTVGHIEGICRCTGFAPSRHAREAILARLNRRRANAGLGPIW